MNLYLTGPRLGYFQGNREVFEFWAETLTKQGFTVASPVSLDAVMPLEDHTSAALFNRDIPALLVVDAVAALPGWREADDSRFLVFVAGMLGRPIYELPQMKPVPASKMPQLKRT